MTDTLILENVSKKRKETSFALKNISFSVPSKKIVGFIGKNGAGKSTTIKTILESFEKPHGNIYFMGENLKDLDATAKRNIGVVFDDVKLQKELNVIQVDKVFKNIYDNWDSDCFLEYIKAFNLPRKSALKTFSRGMSMKLSLAVTLSYYPKLLILDEATAGLDPAGREEILEILKQYVDDTGSSILMSSHITSDIESIADSLVFIKDGRIVLDVDKEYLRDNFSIIKCSEKEYDKLSKEFIVAKRMNDNQIELVISKRNKYQEYLTNETAGIDDISKVIMRGEIL